MPGIEFYNVRTKERITLTEPHHIAAYINSSDLHVNALKGQDFGWRLAPAVVVQIDKLRGDFDALQRISQRIGVPVDEITTINLVNEISYQQGLRERAAAARLEAEPEYKADYEAELESLRKKGGEKPAVKRQRTTE